ncbi:MAG: sodium:proton antiporter [Planctomycetes bacterium]|nr:sodium:proton antiporter [Planctomycetota bacterium]
MPEHAALPIWTVTPFALFLLTIAVAPLAAHHFWESNRNKGILAALFALPVVGYLLAFQDHGGHWLLHAGEEYVSFIALLAALFVISGGVYVRATLPGTPLVNTAILAIGGLLASVVGTTGASMLLIRPLLRANAKRARKAHAVVFFIFVVSNCGGLLTPLGDPPLFLGFLKGVPFEWTFRLWKEWLVVNAALLVIFNFLDQRMLAREEKERSAHVLDEVVHTRESFGIDGALNLLFLLGVVGVILASGNGVGHGGEPWPWGVQEGMMAALAIVAYRSTRGEVRKSNGFTFTAINEVAILFAGIFVTMIPALQVLNQHGKELPLHAPWQFFWMTGVLSSFLDNAPTYLTFAATACGKAGVSLEGRYLAEFLATGGGAAATLAAISCGAVLMGANTYIGNGPNFMVKAIAEENGVKMPSFFGYMAWSCAILIPLFVAVTFLFFRS